MEATVIGAFMFVFGSMVGSFLNVCIVRMPHEQSVVAPRSHCVRCQKMIPWYDNIPFVSYLILRGKCRFCGEKISPRYFTVELITALVFLMFYRHYGLNVLLWPYLVMMSGFRAKTFASRPWVQYGASPLFNKVLPDTPSFSMEIGRASCRERVYVLV